MKSKKDEITLLENERIDDLQYNNLRLVQNSTKYSFTSDAVLLANFAVGKEGDTLVDLCTGSGVVATLTQAKNNLKVAYGVELQKDLFDLAIKSMKLNSLEDKLQFINAPVQKVQEYFGANSIDIVCANPPYEQIKGHYLSKNEHLNICKYEVSLTLEELIKAASYLLKFGGKFFMIHKTTRLPEIIVLLKKYKLEPKIIRLIQPKQGKNSNVFLIQATHGAKEGVRVLPTLILNKD